MTKKKKGTYVNLGRIVPKPTSELKPKESEETKIEKEKEKEK